MRSGRFDEAIAALADAGSDRLSVPFLKGLALFGKGDLEPAADAVPRGAARLDSEFLPAAFYLGACYAAGGRDREAAGAWQTSLVSESEARIVYDVLADALLAPRGRRAGRVDPPRRRSAAGPTTTGSCRRLAAAQAMQRRRAEALVDARALPRTASRRRERPWFLALRILYDAHAAGGTVDEPRPKTRARAARYAAAYKAPAGRASRSSTGGRRSSNGRGRRDERSAAARPRPAERRRVCSPRCSKVQSKDCGAVNDRRCAGRDGTGAGLKERQS